MKKRRRCKYYQCPRARSQLTLLHCAEQRRGQARRLQADTDGATRSRAGPAAGGATGLRFYVNAEPRFVNEVSAAAARARRAGRRGRGAAAAVARVDAQRLPGRARGAGRGGRARRRGALGTDDIVRRHARVECARLVADHADLWFDAVDARRACFVRSLEDRPGLLAEFLGRRYAASPQLLSELVPPSLRPVRLGKARRLCTKAAQDAIDDAKALTGNGVEYTGSACRRGDVAFSRRGRRAARTVGIVTDVDGNVKVGARGPRKRAGRPGAKYPNGDVLLRRCSARGPGARARGRRRRAAVPVGPQAGLSGRLAARGDAELARAARLLLEPPTRRPTRRAAGAAGPARRRGAVADLRQFRALYEDACGEFDYWPAPLGGAAANQAEARCLTLFGRLVELLDGHAWARDLFDAMLAEAGADDEN